MQRSAGECFKFAAMAGITKVGKQVGINLKLHSNVKFTENLALAHSTSK